MTNKKIWQINLWQTMRVTHGSWWCPASISVHEKTHQHSANDSMHRMVRGLGKYVDNYLALLKAMQDCRDPAIRLIFIRVMTSKQPTSSFCQPRFFSRCTNRLELVARKCRQLGHLGNFQKVTENLPFSLCLVLRSYHRAHVHFLLWKFLSFIHSFIHSFVKLCWWISPQVLLHYVNVSHKPQLFIMLKCSFPRALQTRA